MAYALLAERLERHLLADRQVAATLIAAGADMQLPDLGEALTAFDAALVAAPESIDVDELELRRELGVA